jgi:hypothetical protein
MNYLESQFYLTAIFLAFLFSLFPEDCIIFAGLIRAWLQVGILNYYLMFRAWLMYRQIKADMAKLGMPAPKFKFVPIWQRPPLERKP